MVLCRHSSSSAKDYKSEPAPGCYHEFEGYALKYTFLSGIYTLLRLLQMSGQDPQLNSFFLLGMAGRSLSLRPP